MSAPQNMIAVVFDFDDTLTDDSTTALLASVGIDTNEFWGKKAKALLDQGWDPTPAYLKLLLDNVGEGKPFGKLTNAKLREFGATLSFYQGLPGLFNDLKKSVAEHQASSPGIEFYVISGGLEEVIRGSSIAKHLTGIWGCQFAEEDGEVRHIRNLVSFTEKTKYLFQINKGLPPTSGPYQVNELVPPDNRRIPFPNMIYVGDGLTDVPCFSLLDHFGGTPFGVFDAKKSESPKKAWEKLVTPKRVTSMNAPKYRKIDDLGALLRVAVKSICLRMDSRTGSVRL
jgi:phosphoserine phosphatase